jgi:adenylyltransferase/sulfurtransferase
MSIDNSNQETDFSDKEWLRYARHLQLPQVGVEGQTKLKNAHVLIIGAGGLGSPVAFYLAAAGIGHITMVDGDTVDLTNLQRQILFQEQHIGLSKAAIAREQLLALNASIEITAFEEHLSTSNARTLIQAADLVLDCTDNFATRYLINDHCVALEKPWLFASIYQFSGQCALFVPGGACFRCLFPESPQGIADCNTAGVLGVLPGLLGTIQATEAIKYLCGMESALANVLLMVETSDMSFNKIQLAKAPHCAVCSPDNKKQGLENFTDDYQWQCEVSDIEATQLEIPPSVFFKTQDDENILLLDVRTSAERGGYHIGGQHIPLDQLENKLDSLSKNKKIICYCQSGIRSLEAARRLSQAGKNAISLQGGLFALLKFKNSK